MSLGSMLNNVIRPKICESVFNPCLPGDRMLVENILMVAQEICPALNVTTTSINKKGLSYTAMIPLATASEAIGLHHLRDIQAFCPGRIQNIYVIFRNETMNIQIEIQDETAPITSTQLDIVRISRKRQKV